MNQFPIVAEQSWQESAMHMKATATLTAAGQLQATIDTWSTWKLKGFTGGCFIQVRDLDRSILFEWAIHPLGVDGTWIGTSRRSDQPWITVPPDVTSRADQLTVACRHVSKQWLHLVLWPQVKQRALQYLLTTAAGQPL